jgi:hypothetical protein
LFIKQYAVRGRIVIFKLPAPDRPAKGSQENKSYGKTGSQQQYDKTHGYMICEQVKSRMYAIAVL